VDVKKRGVVAAVRLDASRVLPPRDPDVEGGQLAAALATETRLVVLVGDSNSHIEQRARAILAGAGFHDVGRLHLAVRP